MGSTASFKVTRPSLSYPRDRRHWAVTNCRVSSQIPVIPATPDTREEVGDIGLWPSVFCVKSCIHSHEVQLFAVHLYCTLTSAHCEVGPSLSHSLEIGVLFLHPRRPRSVFPPFSAKLCRFPREIERANSAGARAIHPSSFHGLCAPAPSVVPL